MSIATTDSHPGPAPRRAPPLRAERDILGRYAGDGAFLWHLRGVAVKSFAYDARSLAALDERLDAQLDGLRAAADDGWDALALAMHRDAEPGHAFLGAVLAIEQLRLRVLADLLDAAAGEPPFARALASALAWLPWPTTARILPGLLAAGSPPELRHIGVAACAAHRMDPGPLLRDSMYSNHAPLRARAMKAAGELGLAGLRRDVASGLAAAEPEVRLRAAWSGALLGDPGATPVLQACAEIPGRGGELAAQMAARRMDVQAAGDWLRSLAPRAPRAALLGAAALGDPALLPWLIGEMRRPASARLAAFAASAISGMNLREDKLAGRRPAGFEAGPSDDPDDSDVDMDPDDGLSFPDPDAAAAWWSWRRHKLRGGQRLLLGRPMDPEWLADVLANGSQPLRAHAALELACRRPGAPCATVHG